MKIQTLGFMLAAAWVAGFFALPAQAAPGTWSMATSLPFARDETAGVTMKGKIYLIGGETKGVPNSTAAQVFDPAAKTWRDLAPLPSGASHMGIAAMGGKIYAVGGFTANVHANPVDHVYAYDPAKNVWTALPPLSMPLGSPGAAAVGGKLHVIGGRGADKVTVATHQVYDPKTGKWSMAAPLPLARDHFGILVVAGKIHVFGGRTDATTQNVTRQDVYDPATDSWSEAAPMLSARSSGAATLYHGLILYAGGECKDRATKTAFDENEAYNPKTNSWQALTPLPKGRHAFAAGSVGKYAYFIGGDLGCGGVGPSTEVLAFHLP